MSPIFAPAERIVIGVIVGFAFIVMVVGLVALWSPM